MDSNISVFKSSEDKDAFIEAYNELMRTWSMPYEDLWIDTSFGKTHVVAAGPSDGKPIVLISGAQATSGMWGPMIPVLANDRRIFCLDLIDQVGLSKPTKILTGFQDSNAWLEEIFNGLSIEKADIVGNSMGSFMTAMFSVAHPSRVQKIVLSAPAATVTGVRLSYISKVLFMSMASRKSITIRFLKSMGANLVNEKNKLFQVLLIAMSRSKVTSKIIPRPLTADELRSLKSPTMIILGAKDMTSNKAADTIVKELNRLQLNFQYEIIENAGHLWTEKQYELAGISIKRFLSNIVE